jgi:hypothetical protein
MKSVKIGDIVEVMNGYAFDSESFNSNGKGLPIIRIRDIVQVDQLPFTLVNIRGNI